MWLLRGIEIFSEEKVKELARFGSKGSPEMKAEVVKSAGGKMKPGMRPLITIKVGVQGWGDTLDTFEVDGDAMRELATRGTPSLPRVASIVGSCLNMQEVYCRTSVMSVPVLSEIADHLDRVGGSLEHLELGHLSRWSHSKAVELVFKILKLSNTWKIEALFWDPHGSRLAGLNGDTNISTGQYQLRMDNIILIKHSSVVFLAQWRSEISNPIHIYKWRFPPDAGNIGTLYLDRGLKSVDLDALKKLWRISERVNTEHHQFLLSFFLSLFPFYIPCS